MQRNESVPSILESDATGKVAEIYADIRKVLGTSIVNLVWRNLATMPDALEWTWLTAKPLYLGPAPGICRGSATRDRPSRGAVLFLRHARRCRIEQ